MFNLFGSSTDMRLEKIVARLLQRTKQRKLTWILSGNDVVTTKFEQFTARIAPGLVSPILYFYDDQGEQIMTYTGGTRITGESPGSSFLFSGKPNYDTTTVAELYETAKRAAKGVDDKLDAIEVALDKSDH